MVVTSYNQMLNVKMFKHEGNTIFWCDLKTYSRILDSGEWLVFYKCKNEPDARKKARVYLVRELLFILEGFKNERNKI